MVTIAQLNGPMWAVDGQTIEVPAGVHPSGFVLDQLPDAEVAAPRQVAVRPAGQEPFILTLEVDGAVTTNVLTDPRILHWLRAAHPAAAGEGHPQLAGWPMYGVHHGSGVTSWAELLGGTELTDPADYQGRIVLVARTTLQGVEAVKPFMHQAGVVLLVADAPGALPADVRRGTRVLFGAAPLVFVPWVRVLRGTLAVSHTRAVTKAAAKIATAIRTTWKDTP